MDTALLTALSALTGSLIGASASVVTSYLAQRGQNLAATRASDRKSRETLYSEFISEASARYSEALQAEMPNPAQLVALLALVHRIRLYADKETVAAADNFIRSLVKTYFASPVDIKHAEDMSAIIEMGDPLLDFSTQARTELVGMR
jgi:hypothetical protein